MPKPLKLDPDGTLAVPEAVVERTIAEFLAAEGWLVYPLKAEARMPSGAPAHVKGTLDLLAVRRSPGCVAPKCATCHQALFVEVKRKYARTGKKHLAEQVAMAAWLTEKGFPVCRIPEGWADPVRFFVTFYRENFS